MFDRELFEFIVVILLYDSPQAVHLNNVTNVPFMVTY